MSHDHPHRSRSTRMKTATETQDVPPQEQPMEAHAPGDAPGEVPPVIDLESVFQFLLVMDQVIQAQAGASFEPEAIGVVESVPLEATGAVEGVSVPSARSSRQRALPFVLLVLCLLAAGAAILFFLVPFFTASATVVILPVERQISATTALTVVPGNANPNRYQVPGRLLSPLTLSEAHTVPTTGTGHQLAQAARGTIIFYNAQPSVQTIPAGTLLTGTSGVAVVIEQEATLPPAVYPTFGQVSILAHAAITGPAGNLKAGDIYGPCCRLNVSAVNEAFHGGQDARSFPMVTAQDLSRAVSTLKSDVMQSVEAAFQAEVHPNETLLAPSCTPQVMSDHQVGEEAISFSVTVNEICAGEAYNTQALQDLVTQVVTQQASRQLGEGYALAGRVQARVVKSTSERGKQGSLTLQVTGRGAWVYQFTQAQLHHLATLIAGKSTREARTILLGVAGVQSVTIQLNGTGVETSTTLPGNPAQIKMGELIGL